MRVAFAADHAGAALKDEMRRRLDAAGLGHETIDLGGDGSDPTDDYPDFAARLGYAVRDGEADRGILICGSGVGASVAANKIRGVRTAVCHDTYSAHQGVEHDDMNVLTLGLAGDRAGAGLGVHRRLPRRDVQRRAAPPAPARQGPRDRGRGIAEPLWAASASDLARRIRAREVSSVEAVEACLARIAEVNPRINAVVALADDAREQARAADVRLARGEIDGPLHGVPFTIKDSLDTAGLVTTAGTIGWRNRVPGSGRDRRRPAAGGRRDPPRQDEHARVHLVERDRQRRLRPDVEPVRPRRGRPAAAPAARRRSSPPAASPFDIGSDTGDSIRQPAHVCGVAGIKPTQGRVPRTGHWPGFAGIVASLQQLGPDRPPRRRPRARPPDHRRAGRRSTRTSRRSRSATRTRVDVGGAPRRSRSPTTAIRTPTRRDDRRGGGGRRRDRRRPGRTVDVGGRRPDIAEAADTWDRLIRADGHAWLRRLIAGGRERPGVGHVRDPRLDRPRRARRSRGDELTALVEHADRRPLAAARAGSTPT